MKDFTIGLLYSAACFLATIGLYAIAFWLPFAVLGIICVVGYFVFMRGMYRALLNGELILGGMFGGF